MANIEARIKRKRLENDWSIREFADRLHLSPTYISMLERGLRSPSAKVAEKLARVLGDDPELYANWPSAGKADKKPEKVVKKEAAARKEEPEKADPPVVATVKSKVMDEEYDVKAPDGVTINSRKFGPGPCIVPGPMVRQVKILDEPFQ